MTALSNAEGTEKQLETLIKTQGYKDALVDAEGDKINITVMSDKHSNAKLPLSLTWWKKKSRR